MVKSVARFEGRATARRPRFLGGACDIWSANGFTFYPKPDTLDAINGLESYFAQSFHPLPPAPHDDERPRWKDDGNQ